MANLTRRDLIAKIGVAGAAAAWPLAPTAAASAAQPADVPAGPVYDVRAFGARGDGTTLDTAAIQGAIEACASAGGGVVLFPAGRFLSGGLTLRSRVTLRTSPGTVVLGSPRLGDYPVREPRLPSWTRRYVEHALIYGEDLDRVGIEGPGVVDGQGAAFAKQFGDEYLKRPYLVRLVECRDVTVRDVTLADSAMWTLHLLGCRRARVDGVRILANVAANNDGIDIDACEDVAVTGCFIDSGDDAVVLKATLPRPCRHVVVADSVLASHCNAFKLGTESHGGFQDVALSNCVLRSPSGPERDGRSPRGISAIALETVDGGTTERIAVNSVVIQGYKAAIFLRLGDRGRRLNESDPRPAAGSFRGVTISRIVGEDIGRTGCAIAGLAGHPLVDVALDDISLRFDGGGTAAEGRRADIPENGQAYPEADMFGVLPAYGFYARHVRNLRLRNLDLGFAAPDARPPLVFDDVERLELAGVAAQTVAATECLVRMRAVRDAMISGCRPDGPLAKPADMDASCRDIRWGFNAF